MPIYAPFHLSFEVSDYTISKTFYTKVLGGLIEVDNGKWCNINLFGHQITLHHNPHLKPQDLGNYHWGLNLDWNNFEVICKRLIAVEAPFLKVPEIQNAGTLNERVKAIFRDPDGYVIELKVIRQQ